MHSVVAPRPAATTEKCTAIITIQSLRAFRRAESRISCKVRGKRGQQRQLQQQQQEQEEGQEQEQEQEQEEEEEEEEQQQQQDKIKYRSSEGQF